MSLSKVQNIRSFFGRSIRSLIQPIAVRFIDKRTIKKLLSDNTRFRKSVLSSMNELTLDTPLDLYVYHPELNVLEWKSDITRLFLTLKEELFLPGNVATDSDSWIRALDKLKFEPNIVFDVGVNSGLTTAWFAERAKFVYSFEPNEDNVAKINQIKKIRNLDNVEIVNCAVSNKIGRATLYLKPYIGLHSLANIRPDKTVGTVEVPTVTIDQFCMENNIENISILKIDVEGFELEVLQGAESLLKNNSIELILFEYSPDFYKQRDINSREILEYLQNMGYELYEVSGNPVDIDAIESNMQTDLFAISTVNSAYKSSIANL